MSVNNTTLYFIYNKNSILSGRHASTSIRSSSDTLSKQIQELSIFQCIVRSQMLTDCVICTWNTSSSSALQLFMSCGLLNYFFPLLTLLRLLFPIIHPHLPQVIPHVVLPLTLGLPFGLVAYGFHLYMVLATLLLVILSTCPNQPGRLYFIYLTIFSLLIASSNSSFVMQQLDVYY